MDLNSPCGTIGEERSSRDMIQSYFRLWKYSHRPLEWFALGSKCIEKTCEAKNSFTKLKTAINPTLSAHIW